MNRSNRSIISSFWPGIVCMFLFGCATGPTYNSVKSQLPPVPSGKGRVYIYRASLSVWAGSGIQPDVLIDGQRAGSAIPNGFFFVDLPPGSHTVSCQIARANINLLAGQSRYVLLEPYNSGNILWNVRPILIDPDQGGQEISKLSYIKQ